MRNLEVKNLETSSIPDIKYRSQFCSDAETGDGYVVTGNRIIHLNGTLDARQHVIDELDPENDGVLGFAFISEFQSLCIATKAGDILLFDVASEKAEVVGNVSGGILAMQWSPDYELVVVVSGEEKVLLMTKDFDPVSEKSLHPDEFGECSPITAGWGSKETQFHGSEGKQAAKVEVKPPDPVSSWDDRQPRVSWRGDGQYFVTSSVDPSRGNRKLRIWSREGALQYTGEDINGLEQALSWKPSGSLIASSQHLPNKHKIIFFEKNGLNHGEFQLPFAPREFEVKELSWSTDSSVLAVVGSTFQTDDCAVLPKDMVLLYTVNNYHWYLKQTLEYDGALGQKLAAVAWDEGSALRLHVLCTSGSYYRYTWSHAVHAGPSVTSEGAAVVAVIDADRVLTTPFRTTVVPPPMCCYKVRTGVSVDQVAFGVKRRRDEFFVVLQNGKRILFVLHDGGRFVQPEGETPNCKVELDGPGAGNGFRTTSPIPSCYGPYRIEFGEEFRPAHHPFWCHHWTWVSEDQILCICTLEDNVHQLARVDVVHGEGKTRLIASIVSPLEDSVRTVSASPDGSVVCLQFQDGRCASLSEAGTLEPWLRSDGIQLELPKPCRTVLVCEVLKQPRVLGLSDRFELFCDEWRICDNCTSFRVHGKFLLLTTHAHTLRCLLLDHDLPSILNGNPSASLDDSPRQLERGSLLVTSVLADGRVVLQLPRGNLETISPRALVLDRICEHLDRIEFEKAFSLMKVHRINLNLLCDHDPAAFLEHLEEFVSQIGNSTDINLFLTELSDQDVANTLYASAYRSRSKKPFRFEHSKNDHVCDALRDVLERLDYDRFLLSILTCHAKKNEPELDQALFKIHKLKGVAEEHGTTLDQALKYILYLVDTNDLFNVALGTYNFDLVLMVAEKSQKDPKEYVPFLNELNKLELNYRRFKIDLHLGRHEKALRNISLCGESHFEECLNLIKSHRLFTSALYLFPEGSDQYKEVWGTYGDYLLQKKHYEEAGLVYQRCGKLEKALTAFELCLNWSLLVSVARQLDYAQDKLQSLARRAVDAMLLAKRHKEAAEICECFVKDEYEVIRILVDAHLWDDAFAKIHQFKTPDLLDRLWRPAVKSEFETLAETANSLFQTWSKHVQRLMIVRELKKTVDQDGDGDVDDGAFSDVASVTSKPFSGSQSGKSGTSLSGSIATMRTSRNRKKQERKKYVLKEGSRYEDLALVVALGELVSSVDKLQDECKALLKALVMAGSDEDARALQRSFSALLSEVERDIPKVWPPESAESSLPLGPQSSSTLIAEAVQRQLIVQPVISDPALRRPPVLRNNFSWKLNMLS
ncbi:putative elongator complex protein 1 [Ixodes scapularis]|uniref:putative elongator complex protein 1 n=1 Tax=Ixodes scapularis TaxID=6945 RepID=UPI001A9ECD50|nr:putative elongator complex protein 1 [Ixodes scapularis]